MGIMPTTQRNGTLTLFDLFSEEDFNAAIEAKLITICEDGEGLRILNYSDSAIYTDGAWDNPAVRTCRGLIVDAEDRVIARPWAKFFNHGQVEAGDLDMDAPVEVTDKADGSLGIIHRALDGRQRVASRGSFESDQAHHATEILRERYPDLASLSSITPLVEIIYPANRIVVDYHGLDDLILLGGVVIQTGEYLSPEHAAVACAWNGPVVDTFPFPTLRDALAAAPRPGMEGLCVRYLDRPQIVKVKQDDYVRLHRIVTGLSEKRIWEYMSDGKRLTDLLEPLPDELHPWARDVWLDIERTLDQIHDDARRIHREIIEALPTGWERRDYAQRAVRNVDLRAYLFQILDNRDPRPSILRNLKPAGDRRPRDYSEAVA